MKLSPLQLEHYHFTRLSITARENIDNDEMTSSTNPYPSTEGLDINTSVSLGEPGDDDDPHQFAVTLHISCAPPDDSDFPYDFDVAIEGVFSIEHKGTLEERRSLVVCNGASMLFGAAREVLLSATARQKYGPMLLPSANFYGMVPEARNQAKPATEST
ncbi:protein-export chaperone SecB [Massilia solisilvae]|uniref:Protein-export chaperone SecB n=1 Tax=Massilia solisilvae TaxID=1811225 RepID=A0ABT2BFU7_9BURK|nr:protein-export chaperone SecB [Massilia solisilvae]MCS0607392.1 protein-export chaperone SecB [Massilia solisilvae]